MVQKLLAAGASLDLTDHKGNTPLHIACRFSSTKCLEELARGVPLDKVVEAAYIRNHQGQTCIHVATERGNTDALRKMKSIGIDMNIEVCVCGWVCGWVWVRGCVCVTWNSSIGKRKLLITCLL